MSVQMTAAVWAASAEIMAAVEKLPPHDRCSPERALLVALYLADQYRDARGFVDDSVAQVSQAVGFAAKRTLTSLHQADVWATARRGNSRVSSRREPGPILGCARPAQAVPADDRARPARRSARPAKGPARPAQADASPPVPHLFPARATPRPRDPIWDALVAEVGCSPTTKSERGAWNRAAGELRTAGASADDVRMRAETYRTRWPRISLTPTALAKHWGALGNGDEPDDSWPSGWS